MRHHVAWIVAVLGSLACSAPARAEVTIWQVTIWQPITRLLYSGDSDYTFFVGANRWGRTFVPQRVLRAIDRDRSR